MNSPLLIRAFSASSIMAIALLSPPSVPACSIALTPLLNMPANFTIQVQDDGTPVSGLSVRVESLVGTEDDPSREGKTILRGRTDHDGNYSVEGLPQGDFKLFVAEDTAFSRIRFIRVVPHSLRRLPRTLLMSWSGDRIHRLQKFHGFVRNPGPKRYDETEEEILGPPIPNAKIAILDARSNTQIAETMTDANGSFSFSALPPGIYQVNISYRETPPNLPPGISFSGPRNVLIPLEITFDVDAPADRIEIVTWSTSCGNELRISLAKQ